MLLDATRSIQTLISAGGLLLGLTYIVGGLIVNLHLSHYGVTEYQIVRVKYFVVGLTYLTNVIAIVLLAAIPALFVTASGNGLVQQVFLIVSLVASLCLLWLWTKTVSPRAAWFVSGPLWVILGAVSAVYPLSIAARLILGGPLTYDLAIGAVLGLLAGTLTFVGLTYYYSRHVYGRPNPVLGAVDPIGMGIPVAIQFAGLPDSIALLEGVGVAILKPGLTDQLELLDETDTHYIVGVANPAKMRAVKVAKDLVKAILYL